MKLLLVLTSVIAVFTAEYRDNPGSSEREPYPLPGDYNSENQNEHFPGKLLNSDSIEESQNILNKLSVQSFAVEADSLPVEPVDRDSTDKEQESIEIQVLFTDRPPGADFFDVDQHYIKKINGSNEMELRGKKQDEILKELTKSLETFKYIMTHAYSELKVELQSIKEHQTNITNIGTELKEDQKYIREHQSNLTDTVTDFKVELQSIRDHQDNNTAELTPVLNNMNLHLNKSISLIISKIDSIKAIRRCQGVGSFHIPGSSKCYNFYNDTKRTWTEAKGKCQTEGLILAEPVNAVSLRKYLVETYAQKTDAHAWLGARGTGSYYKWESSGKPFSNSDSLWYNKPSGSSLSTSYSILMLVEKTHWLAKYPNQPYYAHPFSSKYYTVCEYA